MFSSFCIELIHDYIVSIQRYFGSVIKNDSLFFTSINYRFKKLAQQSVCQQSEMCNEEMCDNPAVFFLVPDLILVFLHKFQNVNDRFERANNVIVFNLKEHVSKVEDDKLVESLILFIIGHSTTFKCTRLGKKEESITRPVKIKFHNLSVKNEFMHHLSKLKNAPSEFNNISIKHDMTPDERSREKELYLKAKDLNNESSNPSKNEFYVVRGPVWDRKIVKVKKRENRITNMENNN